MCTHLIVCLQFCNTLRLLVFRVIFIALLTNFLSTKCSIICHKKILLWASFDSDKIGKEKLNHFYNKYYVNNKRNSSKFMEFHICELIYRVTIGDLQ